MAFFSYYAPPGWCRDLPNFRDPDSAVLVAPNNSEKSLKLVASCENTPEEKSASDFVANYLSKFDSRFHSKAIPRISTDSKGEVNGRIRSSWYLPPKFEALKLYNSKSAAKLKSNSIVESDEDESCDEKDKVTELRKFRVFGDIRNKSLDYNKLRNAKDYKPQSINDVPGQPMVDVKLPLSDEEDNRLPSIENRYKTIVENKQKSLNDSKYVQSESSKAQSEPKQETGNDGKYSIPLEKHFDDRYKRVFEAKFKADFSRRFAIPENKLKLSNIKTPLLNNKTANITKIDNKQTSTQTNNNKHKLSVNKVSRAEGKKVFAADEKSSGFIGPEGFMDVIVKSEALPNTRQKTRFSVKNVTKFTKRPVKSVTKPIVKRNATKQKSKLKDDQQTKPTKGKTTSRNVKNSSDSKPVSKAAAKAERIKSVVHKPSEKIEEDLEEKETLPVVFEDKPIEIIADRSSGFIALKQKARSSMDLSSSLEIKIKDIGCTDFKSISKKISDMTTKTLKTSDCRVAAAEMKEVVMSTDAKETESPSKKPVCSSIKSKNSLSYKTNSDSTPNDGKITGLRPPCFKMEYNANKDIHKPKFTSLHSRNNLIFINEKLTKLHPFKPISSLSLTNIKKRNSLKKSKASDTTRKKKQPPIINKKIGKENFSGELFSKNEQQCTQLNENCVTSTDSYNSEKSLYKWPIHPLTETIRFLKKMPSSCIIADFGSGNGEIRRQLPFLRVHTLGGSQKSNSVSDDLANTPLKTNSVHVAIFCMSLVGGKAREYLSEANRVLRIGGLLKIVDLSRRIPKIKAFVATLQKFGFLILVNNNLDIYRFLDFKKVKDIRKDAYLPPINLT